MEERYTFSLMLVSIDTIKCMSIVAGVVLSIDFDQVSSVDMLSNRLLGSYIFLGLFYDLQ